MSYDEVEIEDMQWSEDMQAYTYQCPCGDLFQITLVRLHLRSCSAGRLSLAAARLIRFARGLSAREPDLQTAELRRSCAPARTSRTAPAAASS